MPEKNGVKQCPNCGGKDLTEARPFNLMFSTQMGASADPDAIAYLRPETAQSIFVQFKNVLDTSRKKLPFGIAQIGKAFRNEINPRNYIFRSREFEQMELEYFCRPEQGMELLDYWLEERLKFYENIGLPREKLHVLTVPDADRAFYSKGTYDIEYAFPFGVQELEGVAYRTDYDLTQHQTASGKPLDYFDEETKAALHSARDRAERGRRSHRPRAPLRSLRRGDRDRRERQERNARSCSVFIRASRRSRRVSFRF